MRRWCPGAELNHRHTDFQSVALPTELPGRSATGAYRGGSGRCPAERYRPRAVQQCSEPANGFYLTMFMVRSIRT